MRAARSDPQDDVVFIVFDGMKMLDVTGPAEVFAEANRLGATYRLSYVSVDGAPVTTSVGTLFPVDGDSGALPTGGTAVVSGGDVLVGTPIPPGLTDMVRTLGGRAHRIVSICTGSFILAAAGLLDGRRATTHWRHADLLARAYPRVAVEADALFVRDGDTFTSAGVSAGIDLALALVEEDHGADLAREVARDLVVFMQRPGGQSQFSAPLQIRPPRTPQLRAVLELVNAQPALAHTATSMAREAGVSPRHLSRLFAAELQTTPAKFVERARISHAQVMLDAGHPVEETARHAGFGSTETMRRAFLARLGVTPSDYRSRFATTRTSRRGADRMSGSEG
ncbi:GlxA family transcriptional regulator [Nocardioides sp. CPCC 205120]|uniref:GlxA family transcriptional regulator n=1 Tax=Nocardioides sp. CPCC 205120 TaxID=3406462 RepID=UPI003B510B9F